MNLIKEYRLKNKLTQKELAIKVGKSISTIQAIEQNIRKPGSKLVLILFEVLKIPNSKLKFFLSCYLTKC